MYSSVGHQLKAERLARDLTLQDVAHKTRIPVARLQNLEEDNLAAFGSVSYAKNFLKEYGRFLNVDVTGTVESLPPPVLGGTDNYRYLTENLGPWVEAEKKSVPVRFSRKPRRRSPVSTLMTLSALFIVMASLLGVWVQKLVAKGSTNTIAESVAQPADPPEGKDFSAFKPTPPRAIPVEPSTPVPPPPVVARPPGAAPPRAEVVPDEKPPGKNGKMVETVLRPEPVPALKPEIAE
jgi:cytoskeletal protein RodZ